MNEIIEKTRGEAKTSFDKDEEDLIHSTVSVLISKFSPERRNACLHEVKRQIQKEYEIHLDNLYKEEQRTKDALEQLMSI